MKMELQDLNHRFNMDSFIIFDGKCNHLNQGIYRTILIEQLKLMLKKTI